MTFTVTQSKHLNADLIARVDQKILTPKHIPLKVHSVPLMEVQDQKWTPEIWHICKRGWKDGVWYDGPMTMPGSTWIPPGMDLVLTLSEKVSRGNTGDITITPSDILRSLSVAMREFLPEGDIHVDFGNAELNESFYLLLYLVRAADPFRKIFATPPVELTSKTNQFFRNLQFSLNDEFDFHVVNFPKLYELFDNLFHTFPPSNLISAIQKRSPIFPL